MMSTKLFQPAGRMKLTHQAGLHKPFDELIQKALHPTDIHLAEANEAHPCSDDYAACEHHISIAK